MSKYEMNRSNGTVLVLGISLISIFSAVLIALIGVVEKYTWLFLLPLSFSMLSFFFHRVYSFLGKSVTTTLLIALMFLKNVIIPLFMSLGNGYFAAAVDTSDTIFPAILLEIYEEIAIFCVLYLKIPKFRQCTSHSFFESLCVRNDKVKYFGGFVFFLLSVAIICLLLYPQLVSYITVGVASDTNAKILQTRAKILMKETTPSLIYYTYTLSVNILRWIIPAFAMFRLYISKRRDITKIIWSFFAIGISSVMVTDTVAISVYIIVAYAFLMGLMYPAQKKKIFLFSGVVAGVGGAMSLLVKTFGAGTDAALGEIANMLQAYFSGPENVAVALAIDVPPSPSEIAGDVFKFIPYLMYFFKDLPSSSVIFNQTYWGSFDITTQIIPMVAQGARHFTFILAPVYTVIISVISVNWEIKAHRTGTLFEYAVAVIACVCFSMSVAMYSASLCLQMYLNNVLPIQIILWIVRKTSVRWGAYGGRKWPLMRR